MAVGGIADRLSEREVDLLHDAFPSAGFRPVYRCNPRFLGIEREGVAAGERIGTCDDVEFEILSEAVLFIVLAVPVRIDPYGELRGDAAVIVLHVQLLVVVLGHERQELGHDEDVPSAVGGVVDHDPLHGPLGLDLPEVVDEEVVGILELLLLLLLIAEVRQGVETVEGEVCGGAVLAVSDVRGLDVLPGLLKLYRPEVGQYRAEGRTVALQSLGIAVADEGPSLAQIRRSLVPRVLIVEYGQDVGVGDRALPLIGGQELVGVCGVGDVLGHALVAEDRVEPVEVVHGEEEQVLRELEHVHRRDDDGLPLLILLLVLFEGLGLDIGNRGHVPAAVRELGFELFGLGVLEQHLVLGGVDEHAFVVGLEAYREQGEGVVDLPVLPDRVETVSLEAVGVFVTRALDLGHLELGLVHEGGLRTLHGGIRVPVAPDGHGVGVYGDVVDLLPVLGDGPGRHAAFGDYGAGAAFGDVVPEEPGEGLEGGVEDLILALPDHHGVVPFLVVVHGLRAVVVMWVVGVVWDGGHVVGLDLNGPELLTGVGALRHDDDGPRGRYCDYAYQCDDYRVAFHHGHLVRSSGTPRRLPGGPPGTIIDCETNKGIRS